MQYINPTNFVRFVKSTREGGRFSAPSGSRGHLVEPVDLAPLQAYLDRVSGRGRTVLLPSLHHAQALYGWLPREVQEAISNALRVPLADVHGVIEFYSLFYNTPTPRRVVRVCEDPACALKGAEEVLQALERRAGDGLAIEPVTCLGLCEHAPAALDEARAGGSLFVAELDRFLSGKLPEPEPLVYGRPRLMTARIGQVRPDSLADYLSQGGYQGLRRALDGSPEQLIGFYETAGILGRGGAMFPFGRKLRATRQAPGLPSEKHVLVNADESEPGTFKDRALLEGDPFAVIEAATLAAYAVGAENGWIYVRGEYPRVFARLEEAISQARQAGYLGKDILGRAGFHFDIELRLGAGAYICGEETALFEAIEGKRGFPRIKPPFPVTNGLFNQPTAINNVETLAAGLVAWNAGLEAWRKLGTADSPGTKLFCVSGHVSRPGVYELPFGVTIEELLEMAGGPGKGDLQAVLVGGAAGGFIGPDRLATPLTYEDARRAGFPLGSGVLMAFDRSVDLRHTLYQLARFFAHESCGKCFPCQLGTQRQVEILERNLDGGLQHGDREALMDIGFAMTRTSLCGLGQTAASAVLSAVQQWPELVGKRNG